MQLLGDRTISRKTGGREWRRNVVPFSSSFLLRNAEGLLSSPLEKSKQFKTLPELKNHWHFVIPAKSRERQMACVWESCERFLEVFLDLGCIQDRFLSASKGLGLGSMTLLQNEMSNTPALSTKDYLGLFPAVLQNPHVTLDESLKFNLLLFTCLKNQRGE